MSRRLADYAGVFKVTVHAIKDFPQYSGTSGFCRDTCDPYVQIQLGEETYRTSNKPDAGGSVEFDEQFCFNKQEGEEILKVWVYDKDWSIFDGSDCLGFREIDLDDKSTEDRFYELVKDGKVAGRVGLSFETS